MITDLLIEKIQTQGFYARVEALWDERHPRERGLGGWGRLYSLWPRKN